MKTLAIVASAVAVQLLSAVALSQDAQKDAQNLLNRSSNNQVQQSDAADIPDAPPDATLHLRGGSLAAGVGYVWGRGQLSYQGAVHAFTIHGVSVVDVGGAHISATGVVMHMGNLHDFPGTYIAWSAGATVAGGGSAVYLKNEHGVVVKLLSQTVGLRFNLASGGVKVKLKT